MKYIVPTEQKPSVRSYSSVSGITFQGASDFLNQDSDSTERLTKQQMMEVKDDKSAGGITDRGKTVSDGLISCRPWSWNEQ